MLFVGAFDGATQAKRWQLGPFGTYSQGYSSTRFAVGKAHIAVSDFHAALHIYDFETGKEEHTVSLTDKVKALCKSQAPPPPRRRTTSGWFRSTRSTCASISRPAP